MTDTPQVDPEVRRARLANIFKWGIGLLAAVVISPFVFLAVKGIVGLALAAVVGVTVIQLAPVVSFKLANWKMKLIVSEARANPIETMKNLYAEKTEELMKADQNIVDFETEIGNFSDKVEGFKKEYPAEADQYVDLEDKMRSALDDMKSEQKNARKELKSFSNQIDKAEAIYSMALAAEKVTKLSKSAEAQVFAKIKERVAFDAVSSQLNRSFASLNLALERRQDASSTLITSGPTQGVTPITRNAKARISS